MTTKFTWPCPGNPEALKGMPIGMYHCEFCGEMQLAGVPHCPPQFPEQWEEPFPKVEDLEVDDPVLAKLDAVLAKLDAAAKAEDCAEVRFYLEEILTEYPETERHDVWESLDAHRDDPEVRYILKHLSMTKSAAGRWTVELHDGVCCEEPDPKET